MTRVRTDALEEEEEHQFRWENSARAGCRVSDARGFDNRGLRTLSASLQTALVALHTHDGTLQQSVVRGEEGNEWSYQSILMLGQGVGGSLGWHLSMDTI